MKKMADEVDGEDDAAMSPKSALEAKQKQEMKELRRTELHVYMIRVYLYY